MSCIPRVSRLSLLPWLLLVAPLQAQTVRVVDHLGGGQYLDPMAAIAASSPGDTILIRNGGAWGTVSVPIPLRIVAEAPRPVFFGLTFSFSTRPTSPVVVAGIAVYVMTIAGCGSVVLENSTALRVEVYDTTSLLAVDCAVTGWGIPYPGPSMVLTNSNATIVNSTIVGRYGECYPGGPGGFHAVDGMPAIAIEDGLLLVAGSTLTGGAGGVLSSCGTAAPGPAISGQRARVSLTRSTVSGGANGLQVAVALDAASTLAADPSVTFVGTTTPMPAARVLTHLSGSGGAVGLPASVQLLAPPQAMAFIAVADTAGVPTEGPLGSLWVDLDGYIATVAWGFTDGAGQFTFAYTMPPLVVGTPLYFQGLVLPPAALAGLTMPLAVVTR
jgi:hypothetical protein